MIAFASPIKSSSLALFGKFIPTIPVAQFPTAVTSSSRVLKKLSILGLQEFIAGIEGNKIKRSCTVDVR
jgi:hypothetical protein